MTPKPLHHVAGEQETWDLYVCKNCGNSYDAPDTRCGTGWCVPGPSKPKADAEVIQVVPLSRATQAERRVGKAEKFIRDVAESDGTGVGAASAAFVDHAKQVRRADQAEQRAEAALLQSPHDGPSGTESLLGTSRVLQRLFASQSLRTAAKGMS